MILLTPENTSARSNSENITITAGQVTGWDLAENTELELEFESEFDGDYELRFRYMPLDGTGNEPELKVTVNGSTGNQSVDSISLKRTWANDGEPSSDANGNQVRPRQKEIRRLMWHTVRAPLYDEPAVYAISKGKNTIKFTALRENILLESAVVVPVNNLPDYKTYKKQNPEKHHEGYLKIEAEDAIRKSDPSLYAIADKSSPSNSPCDPKYLILNTIGGSNWRHMQQWIEWDVEIPADGYYNISMRLKQNERPGQNSSRRLYVDGEVPYKELNSFEIPYKSGWQYYTVGKDESFYSVYLTQGKHTIRIENTIGSIGSVIRKTKSLVQELNKLYRNILVYIGNSPDPDRDYQLYVLIPDLADTIKSLVGKIQSVKKELLEITGTAGEGYAQFEDLERQLKLFLLNENKIPAQFDLFRSNISSLSEWMLLAQEQPVLIDYIELTAADKKINHTEAGFFNKLWFDLKAFFASFFIDYNTLSSNAGPNQSVTVWVGSNAVNAAGTVAAGRDQANAIKAAVDTYFTPATGISVNLKLVDPNSLIPAVATGNGPDVTIFLNSKSVMDYGFRGALLDLSTYPDLELVLENIHPEAAAPFVYQGKRYALPDSYSFNLMFYRKDIFEQLGLDVPQTWRDIDSILPELNSNFMTIGLPSLSVDSVELFATILYQMGGSAYDEKGTKSMFYSTKGVEAFERWGSFYTKYDVPQKLDLLTYFRTGQAPVIIAPYTFYNNLSVGAPEIDGLWDAVLVPGAVQDNGQVDHTVMGTSTGAVIFSTTKVSNAAWEFLKWWTGDEAQYQYGIEVETALGKAGRIAAANVKAFEKLPWTKQAYNVIRQQMAASKGLPEVPGGYMATRYIPTAMRLVVNNGIYPRDALLYYSQLIDEEIQVKRKEFKLE